MTDERPITRLADAQAMREMNAPLNTPVEEREFTPRAAKQIDDTYRLGLVFKERAFTFLETQNMRSYKALRRAYEKFERRLIEANEDSVPRYVEQPDGSRICVNTECVAVAAFVNKVVPCGQGWQDIFDLADAGQIITDEHLQRVWPFNGVKIFNDGQA